MSTNINITVGDNALLDRAKQQQTANRQAQLNRENSTRLEAQATDERTKALAAEGKDANGNPLYGVPTAIPQIDRRPAANRRPTDYYVAEVRNLAIYQTREGPINLDIMTEEGNEYTFNLANTFAYPDTDNLSSGIGLVYVDNPTFVDVTTTYSPAGVENEPLYEYFSDTSRLSNFTPPPWGNTFSRTDVYSNNTTVATTATIDTLTLLLPVKEDALIMVSTGKGTRFRVSSTLVQSEEHTYVEYADISAPNGVSYRHDFVFDWTSQKSEQLDNFQWIKCFYVNKSICREINAPTGLYDLLKDYLRDFSVSVTWNYDPTSNFLISRINGVETVGSFPEKLITSNFSRSISTPPIFSYKFRLSGFLATNDGQAISTPGIYKAIQLSPTDSRFLNPYNPAAPDYNPNLTDVAYMVTNFYGGSYGSLPKFGLQTKFEFLPEYAPKYYGQYRTKQRPIYNRNLVGAELVDLLDKTKVRTFTPNGLVWDWNNPGYCRQQLLALGFTSADLTP